MKGGQRFNAWRRHGSAYAMLLGLLLMLCAGVAWAGAGQLHAFLDRTQAQVGDNVTLNVQLDGSGSGTTPDLSGLQKDFDVLGTSRSTSLNIVNGNSTQKTLWAVALRPKHLGTLTIPPLTLDGKSTHALTLTVTAAPAAAQGSPGDDVYIQATLDNDTPYVGQQVNLTVRLFYAPNLTDGNLDKPQAQGVDARDLGNSTRYQVERNGRRYHVLEQHYALFAQHAGQITLAPLQFQGNALDADGFPGLMSAGRSVQARSAAVSMQVRTRPDAAGKGVWLPAREVTLSLDGLPTDGRVQVGEPLTLTLSEQARGLPAETLPEPKLPALDGVQTYPDRSEDQTNDDGQWLLGKRTRKFAIVPQHAGILKIPSITLRWWNVVSDHMEVATVPAHTLTVTAAAGSGMATASSTSTAPLDAGHANSGAGNAPVTGSGWRRLALASLLLWVLTMLGWAIWWWRQRASRPRAVTAERGPDSRGLRNAFLHAVRAGDVSAQVSTLLAWARGERPSVRNLGELSAALDSPAQCTAIAALQNAHYAHSGTPPDPSQLAHAFSGGLAWRGAAKAREGAALPPLYPPH